MWVASRGGRERRDKKGFEAEGIRKEFKKNLKKLFKKVLTSPQECGIIVRLSARAGGTVIEN